MLMAQRRGSAGIQEQGDFGRRKGGRVLEGIGGEGKCGLGRAGASAFLHPLVAIWMSRKGLFITGSLSEEHQKRKELQ